MDTHDGFIVGIYEYCDRWCERCPLTSRCRVFADEVRLTFGPGLIPPGRHEPPMANGQRTSLADLWDQVEAAFESASPPVTSADAVNPPLLPDAAALELRAGALADKLLAYQPIAQVVAQPAVCDALDVLRHFGFFLGPKIHRALSGRSDQDSRGPQSDANGSAKTALLALERLEDAWLRLVDCGVVRPLDAEPIVTELTGVAGDIERLFPAARRFVRPGLDEPAAVAMLEWRERG